MFRALEKLKQSSINLFQPVPESVKLLHCVKEANYIKAKELIKNNPQIMFQEASIDSHSETISPLKLAFKLLDTYMWKKIFMDQIKNNPDMMESFNKQIHEQKEHVNLEPFFTAYDEYDALNTIHLKDFQDEKVNYDLQKAWLNIGKAQREREILPRHMLKEFCRSPYAWSKTSSFDVEEFLFPDNFIVLGQHRYGLFGDRIDERITVLPFKDNSGLGFEYTLVNEGHRYEFQPEKINALRGGCFDTLTGATSRFWRFDAAVFRHLYEIRIADLTKQRSLAPIAEQKMNTP